MKPFSYYSLFIVIIVLLSFYSYSEAQQTIEPSEGDLTHLWEKEKKLRRKIDIYTTVRTFKLQIVVSNLIHK